MPDFPLSPEAPTLFIWQSPKYNWRNYLAAYIDGRPTILAGPWRDTWRVDAEMKHWTWDGEKFRRDA